MAEIFLTRQIRDWGDDGPENTEVAKVGGNVFNWDVTICGARGSNYEGGIFHVAISFPQDFPASRPDVRFVTPVFNCSVRTNGEMCLESINNWSRASTIISVVEEIQKALSRPNPDSGANPEACEVSYFIFAIVTIELVHI